MDGWVGARKTVCFGIAPLYVLLGNLYSATIMYTGWSCDPADKPISRKVDRVFH